VVMRAKVQLGCCIAIVASRALEPQRDLPRLICRLPVRRPLIGTHGGADEGVGEETTRVRAGQGPGESAQAPPHMYHLRGETEDLTELPVRDDTVRSGVVVTRLNGRGRRAIAPRRERAGTVRRTVNASIGATEATGRRARRSGTSARRRRRGPRRRRPRRRRRRRCSTAPRRGPTPTRSAPASPRNTRPLARGARRTRSRSRCLSGTGVDARSAWRNGR
jgi:hypothetical protein